jgi:hypothetical protein
MNDLVIAIEEISKASDAVAASADNLNFATQMA